MSGNSSWITGVFAAICCASAADAQVTAPWYALPMYEPGCAPYVSTLDDFDGDGRLDLASVGDAHYYSGTVSVLIMPGRADASFGAPRVVALDLAGALDVEAADINHDGELDLVVVGRDLQCEGRIAVLLAIGGGRFEPAIKTVLDFCPVGAAFGDVDNDGQLDVLLTPYVFANPQQSLLRGHGDGTFAPPLTITTSASLTSPQLFDIDSDGVLDLGATARIDPQWFLQTQHGNGDGTFGAEVRKALLSAPIGLEFHDFDGDGLAEALVGLGGIQPFPSANVELFPGLAGGAFGRPNVLLSTPSVGTLDVRDLDSDGRADVFVGHGFEGPALGGIAWVRGLGGLAFAEQSEIASGGYVEEVFAGDIEGDGDDDFVTLNVTTACEVGVVKALAPGVFDTGTLPVVTAGDPIDAAVGDLDGDGVPDLAAICEDSSEVSFWRGLGDGQFASLPALRGSVPFEQVLLADFNGDGHADVAAVGANEYAPGELRVWRSTPRGFARADVYVVERGPHALACADFDGDGRRDIAVAGRDLFTSMVQVLHARTNGTFELIGAYEMGGTGGNPARIFAGDFDGDGVTDLAQIPGEDCVQVAYGLGGGHLATPVCTATFDQIELHAAGDIDLDGVDDLIMEELDWSAGSLYALYGRPDRTLDFSATPFAVLYQCRGVAIADINGNGRPDVVALDQTSLDIITGDGMRGFDHARGFSLGHESGWPVVADLDLDGRLDVIAPLRLAREIKVLLHH